MTNAETIWNVISWYYGNSTAIGLMLVLMTVYLLGRKKEYRYYTFSCAVLMFLILNQLTYRIIERLGEGDTYYRFLWIFPVSLIAAWGGLRLIEKMKSKMEKVICVAVMVCLIFLYSGGKISDWVTLPENIYQISEDKIQVADLIEEVTGGERVIVYAEDELMYGIREYDANICLATEGEREYLYHIITENDSNASGNLMLGILVNAKIDYIVVRKEYTGAKAALNGGGCVEVGQTDNYILYYVNQEKLKEDLYHTYDSDWKTDAGICNVEDVMIKGLTQEQQFLFYGDGRLDEFNNDIGENRILCDGSEEFYSKEYGDYIVCKIDNQSQGITEQIMKKIESEERKKKPILLFLNRPLIRGEKSDRLLDWIEEGNSYIQAVYAENADESRKDMLTEKVFQCYITNNAAENALLVQVRGE